MKKPKETRSGNTYTQTHIHTHILTHTLIHTKQNERDREGGREREKCYVSLTKQWSWV